MRFVLAGVVTGFDPRNRDAGDGRVRVVANCDDDRRVGNRGAVIAIDLDGEFFDCCAIGGRAVLDPCYAGAARTDSRDVSLEAESGMTRVNGDRIRSDNVFSDVLTRRIHSRDC